MEWVKALQLGQLVALDTAPLIYFIEEHPTYLPIVTPFFEKIYKSKFHEKPLRFPKPLRFGSEKPQRFPKPLRFGSNSFSENLITNHV